MCYMDVSVWCKVVFVLCTIVLCRIWKCCCGEWSLGVVYDCVGVMYGNVSVVYSYVGVVYGSVIVMNGCVGVVYGNDCIVYECVVV